MINNHVLIIEDDKSIAEYFQAVLVLAGMQVDVVFSAREGLVRLTSSVPGLILLDMCLGTEIGGEDILYQIRSNPRFDETRVIIITGYPNTVQMVTALADLVLIKPVDMEQLTTLAQRMMSFEVAPRFFAFRDPVTSLFTLDFFFTRLELAFERAKRKADFLYAVIAFEVEVCGPNAAAVDSNANIEVLLMNEVAKRLKKNLRPTDTIARVAEWKFVTLHEDLRQNEDVEIIVARIKSFLAVPVEVLEQQYSFRAVYGIATRQTVFNEPADSYKSADSLLRKALKVGN